MEANKSLKKRYIATGCDQVSATIPVHELPEEVVGSDVWLLSIFKREMSAPRRNNYNPWILIDASASMSGGAD